MKYFIALSIIAAHARPVRTYQFINTRIELYQYNDSQRVELRFNNKDSVIYERIYNYPVSKF